MSEPIHALADWGTTHLRLWLVDAAGTVLAESLGAEGMGTLTPEAFGPVLEARLSALDAAPTLPVAICGMAGSRQGWKEAPYARLPVTVETLMDSGAAFQSGQRHVHIVSGIARHDTARPDVMRGEETQLLGLDLPRGQAALVCMPGTHSKWVRVDNGVVTDFMTVMTGEFFALLKTRSILRHSTGEDTAFAAGHPAFSEAVLRAWTGRATGLGGLFAVRADTLVNGADVQAATARLSGHLIGTELREAHDLFDGTSAQIHLVGSRTLLALYAAASRLVGLSPLSHDGEAAARNGLMRVARHVFSPGASKAAQ